MTRSEAEKQAMRIVLALFQNGSGEQAERLVLTVDGPPKRDLGGWSEGAVFQTVTKILTQDHP